MKKEELIAELERLGIPRNNYSLGKLQNSDCTCVIKEGNQWNVYYVERDHPLLLDSFSTDSEAYQYVLEGFKEDLSGFTHLQ